MYKIYNKRKIYYFILSQTLMDDKKNKSSMFHSLDNTTGDKSWALVDEITTHFLDIKKHKLYTLELAYYLDNFTELSADRKVALINYLSWEAKYIVMIEDIIEDIKHQDNIHIVWEDEVRYFKEEFTKIGQHTNTDSTWVPIINKLDLFHIDINFHKDHEDDIERILTLILSYITKRSDIFYSIWDIYESLEREISNKNIKYKNITYRLKIAIEYRTMNVMMICTKNIKIKSSSTTEILLSRTYNNIYIEQLLDLVVNIRWWEAINVILENPNKKIDLIDWLDYLEQREEL